MWHMCEICCIYGIWLGVPGEESYAQVVVTGLVWGPNSHITDCQRGHQTEDKRLRLEPEDTKDRRLRLET